MDAADDHAIVWQGSSFGIDGQNLDFEQEALLSDSNNLTVVFGANDFVDTVIEDLSGDLVGVLL